jgi:hypothetical protein
MKQPEHVDPEELRPFIGQWVALDMSEPKERIVGNGINAVEAMKKATDAGYPDACLLMVPRGPMALAAIQPSTTT